MFVHVDSGIVASNLHRHLLSYKSEFMRPLVVLFPGFLTVCLQFSSRAWAQTPIPPSTFPSFTGTTSSTTATTSNTTTRTSTTQTNSAAFPSLTGYSSCVTSCLAMGSSAANCTSVVDVNCYCVSNRFTRKIVDCISSGCPSELSTAESLAQQFCNVPSNSTSLSFPAPTTSTSTPTSSSQTSSTVPGSSTTKASTTTSNAASKGIFVGAGGVGPSTFYSTVVCILGALLGVYLVE